MVRSNHGWPKPAMGKDGNRERQQRAQALSATTRSGSTGAMASLGDSPSLFTFDTAAPYKDGGKCYHVMARERFVREALAMHIDTDTDTDSTPTWAPPGTATPALPVCSKRLTS